LLLNGLHEALKNFVIVQLIKNMKQSLMKQTSNAIKSFQGQPQRSKLVPRKQTNQTAQTPLMMETNTDHDSGEQVVITPTKAFQSSTLQNTILLRGKLDHMPLIVCCSVDMLFIKVVFVLTFVSCVLRTRPQR